MGEEVVMPRAPPTGLHGSGGDIPIVCYRPTHIISNGVFLGDNPLNFSFPQLMMQIIVISFTTKITSFFLQPFKQPSIVVNMLGGILLGPSFLGRYEVFQTMFPLRSRNTMETISMVALLFFVFTIGVKMNVGMVKNAGKRELVLTFAGSASAMCLAHLALFSFGGSATTELCKGGLIVRISWLFSTTFFPVLACFLAEVKCLNTEVGLMALNSSMLLEVGNWIASTASVCFGAYTGMTGGAVWPILTCAAFVLVVVGVARPTMLYIIYKTPSGEEVSKGVIFCIMTSVLLVGFISELIGQQPMLGAFILGLSIPDGPPLGTALTVKLETVVTCCLMPLYFASSGFKINLFNIRDWTLSGALAMTVLFAVVGKIGGSIATALYLNIPIRDALTFSFFLANKGIIEIVTINLWRETKYITHEMHTVLIMCVILVGGICSPLSHFFYQSSKRHVVDKRRGLQHSDYDRELRLIACVYDESNAYSITRLLQISYASRKCPIVVYALQLIELMGRASPLLVAYNPHKFSNKNPTGTDRIGKAFLQYEANQAGYASVHLFSAIAPFATMHEDVCTLALDNRATMIIVPFHKRIDSDDSMKKSHMTKNVNNNILAEAPCSVGILIERKVYCMLSNRRASFRVAVLFLGGRDDREVLAYAERIGENPSVSLTVVRCIPCSDFYCDSIERMIDDDMVGQFRLRCVDNDQVVYREEKSRDGEETMSLILSMGDMFDLFMVGRGPDEGTALTSGLSEWEDCRELGVIGDFLASPDYRGTSAVLVVQQQARCRGKRKTLDMSILEEENDNFDTR